MKRKVITAEKHWLKALSTVAQYQVLALRSDSKNQPTPLNPINGLRCF